MNVVEIILMFFFIGILLLSTLIVPRRVLIKKYRKSENIESLNKAIYDSFLLGLETEKSIDVVYKNNKYKGSFKYF